jgi:hypothetical protein
MSATRNSFVYLAVIVVLTAGLLSSCGGGSSSSDSTAVRAVIGSAGGSMTSSDGTTTLTIPPGALANDTTITMTAVSDSDIPTELRDPSVLKVYDMQPDGLQFTLPATIEMHTVGSPAPPDGTPIIGLISDSDGTLELLGPLTQTVDANGIRTTALISHFSKVAMAESNGFSMTAAISPSSVIVGNDFTLTATISQSPGSLADGTGKLHATNLDDDTVSLSGDFDPPGFTIAPAVGEAHDISRTVTGTCDRVGNARVDIEFRLASLGGTFHELPLEEHFDSLIHITGALNGDVAIVNCVGLPSVPPTTVALGLHNAPGGLTKLEQLILLGSSFANLSGNMLAVFSGAEGYAVSDLTTGEVKRTKTGTAPLFGAVPISQNPPGADSAATVFTFGTSPFLDTYDAAGGDFSNFVFTFTNSISDVSNAGGALTADEQLYVDVFGVNFVAFDTTAGSYQPTSEIIPANGIGNGTQVSAFEQTAGGPVLVVTRVAAPGAGQLFFAPRDATTPTAVGAVGADSRRIRCTAGVCVVTSFVDNVLTIVLFDGINPPTIVGNASVGDGPVDVDLKALNNGNVRVGSTGFNDDTYTLTEIAPDGSVVSNTTLPVDTGCTNPGHLSFFEDGDGVKALVTCYGSDNFDVLSP